jgi:DNA repair protein RadD
VVVLRPNQIEAADAVEEAFRAGIRRPLVDSCVGSGKSLVMAELARRAWERGERSIIGSHTRELVEQNAAACRALGLQCGINAASLGERTWRAPVISAAIQSVYKNAGSFGPIGLFLGDEAHLWPHSEAGMYRALVRDLGNPRAAGLSGTVFRLQGGSLVEGEGAPFDKVVYRYSIVDGIRDGYLVPAFSVAADDKMDPAKLKTRQGEFTGESQDAQMIAAIDNHVAQMIHHGRERRAWLVFEASTKAAKAMTARMNEWGVPTGLVLGETPAGERAATIQAYRAGRLRALVNVAALTTGFDVQQCDMLVMRRATKSLGLYLQMTGRILRTIGGNISASVAAGKPDAIVLDFAGNIDTHGPLDFIRPKETKASLVSCESCGKRNSTAAAKCWACDEPMTKLCPACLCSVAKGILDCPECGHDMRTGGGGEARKPAALLETPSGAALIASYKPGAERAGGWLPIRRAWEKDGVATVAGLEGAWVLPAALSGLGAEARWVRLGASGSVEGLLVPNGSSRSSIRQYDCSGSMLLVPFPAAHEPVIAA